MKYEEFIDKYLSSIKFWNFIFIKIKFVYDKIWTLLLGGLSVYIINKIIEHLK